MQSQSVGERAKELLPSVLLTLTSIIQALALEVLWSAASGAAHLWGGGAAAVAGWLQVAAVFQMILVVWLYYAQLVMRFRWMPMVRDSVIPFGLGLAQFVLAEMLQPERLHFWFFAFAATFAYAAWASNATIRAAWADPDNAWYFARFDARLVSRFGMPVAMIATWIGLGAVTAHVGPGGRWAVAALALTNALLLGQIALQRHYWNRSVLGRAAA